MSHATNASDAEKSRQKFFEVYVSQAAYLYYIWHIFTIENANFNFLVTCVRKILKLLLWGYPKVLPLW